MTRRVERNPRPIARPATLALSLTLLWCLPFTGCASTPAAPAAAPPELERVRAFQERRAAMFRTLESTGTIELRSLVEGGESFDSCAMDLWRRGDEFAHDFASSGNASSGSVPTAGSGGSSSR